MTKEKVVLEQDIWASQVELIDKITCFMKIDEEWKEHKISDFFTGKKVSDNNLKKKDRMVKAFLSTLMTLCASLCLKRIFLA